MRSVKTQAGRNFFNEVNEALFQSLLIFTAGGLEIYYEQFKKSERFQLLKEETEKQEIIYNVLRRYKLIQN